jgi:ubiquinone/menaquinone biosynthesis C-methylase UbiE
VDRLNAIETYWSQRAATFDDEPDHGLTDFRVRAAWSSRLAEWIPPGNTSIVDLGCGTGSLSVLLAAAGHEVTGVDLSPEMIIAARHKALAAGLTIEFRVDDASRPGLPSCSFDVALSRHVLWTLPDPVAALSRWSRMLKPEGRLVLIEGHWFDSSQPGGNGKVQPWDGGVQASELIRALEPMFSRIVQYPLSADAALWGRSVEDERYAVVAQSRIDR